MATVRPSLQLLDRFMFRQPIGQWQECQSALTNGSVDYFFKNEALQKAVAFASPAFFKRLQASKASGRIDARDIEKIENYIKRFSSRLTPFGFFSGIGVGVFRERSGDCRRLAFAGTRTIKRTDLIPASRFRLNETLISFEQHSRYAKVLFNEIPVYSEEKAFLSKEMIALFRRLGADFTDSQFIKSAQKTFGYSAEEAKELLLNLVDEQILTQEDQPQLQAHSEPTLNTILEVQDGLKPKSFTQGVSVFSNEMTLDPQIFRSMNDVLYVLARLRRTLHEPAKEGATIRRVRRFLANNSRGRPFPLTGLSWETLPPDPADETQHVFFEFNQFLDRIRARLVSEGKKFWKIDKNGRELEPWLGTDEVGQNSCYAFLCTVVPQADSKPIVVLNGACTRSATRLLGRFAEWDPRIEKMRELVQRHEVKATPQDTVLCGLLSEIRDDGLGGLKCLHHSYPHTINFSSIRVPNQIDLRDLYVSLDASENLVLTSHKLKKRIDPRLLDALNYRREPNLPFRFLAELVDEGGSVTAFRWPSPGDGIHFLPGMSIGETIILKPQWSLKIKSPRTIQEFKRALPPEMPRQVFLVDTAADTKLFIDLNRDNDLEIVLRETRKDKHVILEEVFAGELESAFETLGFLKQSETLKNKRSRQALPALRDEPIQKWISEYLYFRVFANPMDFNDLLFDFKKMLGKTKASNWFYICYNDREPHLRLRVRLRSAKERAAFIERYLKYLNRQMNLRLVFRYELAPFDPEAGRFLNADGLSLYATISHQDSEGTTHVQQKLRQLRLINDTAFVAAFLEYKIAFWLKVFFEDDADAASLVADYLKSTEKPKEKPETTAQSQDWNAVFSVYDSAVSIKAVRTKLEFLKKDFDLAEMRRFYMSIIHLNFNRIHYPMTAANERRAYKAWYGNYMRNRKKHEQAR